MNLLNVNYNYEKKDKALVRFVDPPLWEPSQRTLQRTGKWSTDFYCPYNPEGFIWFTPYNWCADKIFF